MRRNVVILTARILAPLVLLGGFTLLAHRGACAGVSVASSVVDVSATPEELRAQGWFGDPFDGQERLYPRECGDEVANRHRSDPRAVIVEQSGTTTVNAVDDATGVAHGFVVEHGDVIETF